jgi:subtilisin family serine protease
MVALARPPALSPLAARGVDRTPVDLGALRSQVARSQAEVLARVPDRDFASGQVFRNVPAFTGIVRSERGLDLLASHPLVTRIDLELGGSGHLADSVPVIGGDLRHLRGNTGEGIVVAVLDTGIDAGNEDFAGRLVHEACFLDDDGSIDGAGRCPSGSDRQVGAGAAEDDAGHGTHVTGIVASNGTNTSPGMAPDSSIVSIKVLAGPTFAGVFFAFSEIVAALDYLIDNPGLGVEVINLSLGTNALFDGDCDANASGAAGAAAIDTLRANGVIAFASSGNNGSGSQMPLPACISNVVSVGATNNADDVANFTNSNATTDLMAPGFGIVSSAIGGGTATASGTSMASPHAAGCALLLIETGEATTPDAIEARLKDTPVQVTDPKNDLTFPRIDCRPENEAPEVDAGGPYQGDEGSPIALSAATAADADGDPLTFAWSYVVTAGIGSCVFSDASALQPSFTCNDNGLYTVTLEVSDGIVAVSASAAVTVLNVAPTVAAGPDASVVSGETFAFSGSFSDPGVIDDPWQYLIDWGDGSSTAGSTSDQSAAIEATHQFCAPVDHTVSLTVTDKDGGVGQDSLTLSVAYLAVGMQITPQQPRNPIRLRQGGRLPVAVYSSATFDATRIVPATVTLGDEVGVDTPVAQRPNGTYFATHEDVNGDGLLDLVVHFEVPALVANGDLTAATTELVLRGVLADACTHVRGVDHVTVVP